MKKRFLSIMLTAILAFGSTIATPATTAVTAEAATVPETMPENVIALVKEMSNAELVEILDMARARVGDVNYEKIDTANAAMLRDDCTFLTGTEMVNEYSSNGGWILWLNQAEEEILRQRYPDIFANIPSPICLDAGEDAEDIIVNYNQVKDNAEAESGIAPDFEKIIKILERGPYTVDVTGTLTTNCTGSVKTGQKYTVTAEYEAKASNGGDFDFSYVSISAKYNRKKPTKLEISFYSSASEKEVAKTAILKMSKSLQKKIKTGKVVISGTNLYSNGDTSEISVYKDVTEKSGKVSLSFKFKAKK